MKKLFIIGGMGSGKSTVARALAEQGIPVIDLDDVGHEVLTWPAVKEDLVRTFGTEILDENGEVVRPALAAKAFASAAHTAKLNHITLPRIEEAYLDRVDELANQGHKAVVVEYSAFRNKETSLACSADTVIAVVAPLEERVQRAVASGFLENDVRQRIARQISDEDRIAAADYVFCNDGTQQKLYDDVVRWWKHYRESSIMN